MKKRHVITYIVVMCVLLCTSVYATISGDINLSVNSDKKSLYAGDEFSVTLSLKDLETDGGINAIEGYIDIDENIIEDLTIDSIVTENGKVKINDDNILNVYSADNNNANSDEGIVFNTDPVSGRGDYKIVINLSKKITSDVDLVTVNFKIKSDVMPSTYERAVTYKTFKVFSEDSKEREELSSQAVKVIVSERKQNDDDKNTNNNVNNAQDNNNNNNNNNKNDVNNVPNNQNKNNVVNNTPANNTNGVPKNNTTNKPNSNNNQGGPIRNVSDNTVSETNLPNTGYKLILIPVVLIAILGLVFYKKYSKYNKFD